MRELTYPRVVPHAVTQLQHGATQVFRVLQVGQRHVQELEGTVVGGRAEQHGRLDGLDDALVENTPVGRLGRWNTGRSGWLQSGTDWP